MKITLQQMVRSGLDVPENLLSYKDDLAFESRMIASSDHISSVSLLKDIEIDYIKANLAIMRHLNKSINNRKVELFNKSKKSKLNSLTPKSEINELVSELKHKQDALKLHSNNILEIIAGRDVLSMQDDFQIIIESQINLKRIIDIDLDKLVKENNSSINKNIGLFGSGVGVGGIIVTILIVLL